MKLQGAFVGTHYRVVLKKIGQSVGVKQIVDGNDLYIRTGFRNPEYRPANASEAIYRHACHAHAPLLLASCLVEIFVEFRDIEYAASVAKDFVPYEHLDELRPRLHDSPQVYQQ